jgi:hypothetical protein
MVFENGRREEGVPEEPNRERESTRRSWSDQSSAVFFVVFEK